MYVHGANALAATTGAPVAKRSGSGTFKIASEAAQAAVATGTVRGVSSIDALLALQGIEDTGERRKRAVRRGREVLDALDEVRLGLISGVLEPESLRRLRAAAGELHGDTGDQRLDTVLAEIRLRVDVELAKAGILAA